MFDLRSAAFEGDEYINEISSLEYVVDCFDKMERVNLESEIKQAKAHKDTQKTFGLDCCKWKARLSINGWIYNS